MAKLISIPVTETSEIHFLRSRLLDAFAELETSIRFVQDLAGIVDSATPLGQKIAKLRDPNAELSYSSRRRERVIGMLQHVDGVIEKRNAIVHSRMALSRTAQNEVEATFINPTCKRDGTYHGFRLGKRELSQLETEVTQLALDLRDPWKLG